MREAKEKVRKDKVQGEGSWPVTAHHLNLNSIFDLGVSFLPGSYPFWKAAMVSKLTWCSNNSRANSQTYLSAVC